MRLDTSRKLNKQDTMQSLQWNGRPRKYTNFNEQTLLEKILPRGPDRNRKHELCENKNDRLKNHEV